MNRSWIINSFGGIDSLELQSKDIPSPSENDVLLKVHNVSLNYRDLLMIEGLYNPNQPLPITPCSDAAGEIVEVGSAVKELKAGDRVVTVFSPFWEDGDPTKRFLRQVLGAPLPGVLSEYVVLPREAVLKIPEELSFENAATLPCAGVTAWSAIWKTGGLKPGDTVLTLGTGGVSIFSLQLAKIIGARVIITSKSYDKLERAKKLGADFTINYISNPNWGKVVREITGGVDLAIEVGGAKTFSQTVKTLNPGGRVALIGVLSGVEAGFPILAILMNMLKIYGIFVGSKKDLKDLVKAVITNDLKPVIYEIFPFEDVKHAFYALKEGKHFGKIVVSVG